MEPAVDVDVRLSIIILTVKLCCQDRWYHGCSPRKFQNRRLIPFLFLPCRTYRTDDVIGSSTLPNVEFCMDRGGDLPPACRDLQSGSCCCCFSQSTRVGCAGCIHGVDRLESTLKNSISHPPDEGLRTLERDRKSLIHNLPGIDLPARPAEEKMGHVPYHHSESPACVTGKLTTAKELSI
jgi:hypothetical protein